REYHFVSIERPSLGKSFRRSQIANTISAVVDFGTLIFLVEVLNFWYVLATALGALVGAVANFLLGRYWSFKANHGGAKGQVFRYALVSSASLMLNTYGVFA